MTDPRPNEQKNRPLQLGIIVGCASAIASGILFDLGFGSTASASLVIAFGCLIFCGTEWERTR